MPFEVTILGSSSATPTVHRHPSAQVLNINDKLILIDCGEGTQVQLFRYKIRYQRINRIFITHLHGDHFFGLMGFLSTMHLQGRVNPLTVYGPEPLEEIIRMQLKVSETQLRYPLEFKAVSSQESSIVYEDHEIQVESILLRHRIPCTGYLFREKPGLRRLIKHKITEDGVPVAALPSLKHGRDYEDEKGRLFRYLEYTLEPRRSRSYAYCSDTIYHEAIIPQIANVDLLYHEATFAHDILPRAEETFHSTALQAGMIAQKANAGKLLIGHFSARYKDVNVLLKEAQTVFPNTHLALEGERFSTD
jgi:ribonuclease Z